MVCVLGFGPAARDPMARRPRFQAASAGRVRHGRPLQIDGLGFCRRPIRESVTDESKQRSRVMKRATATSPTCSSTRFRNSSGSLSARRPDCRRSRGERPRFVIDELGDWPPRDRSRDRISPGWTPRRRRSATKAGVDQSPPVSGGDSNRPRTQLPAVAPQSQALLLGRASAETRCGGSTSPLAFMSASSGFRAAVARWSLATRT
jgi:hypothetical protein